MKEMTRVQGLNCWQLKFEKCVYSESLLNKLATVNEQFQNQINLLEIKKAIYYARKYHGTQKRQSGEPYYSHPLAVAEMVIDYCFETDAIIGAILHDTAEDTNLTIENISNIFGRRVAQIVERLTRIKNISAAQLIMQAYVLNDAVVVLIKLLDRLHNLQTIYVKSKEKQQKTYLEVLETFFLLAFKLDYRIVNKFCDYLNTDTTIQKQEHSIFSYGIYQLQFPRFQNNF